jgi:hypothetical protein
MEILENSKEKDWAKCYKAVNFIEKGVCTYQDEVVYLNQDTLEKCVRDIKGKPVIIKHQRGINPDNMQQHAVGYVTGAGFDEFNASFSCDFVLFDEEAKSKIANGWSVSCAYLPKAFGQGGTWHNTAYDREITDLEFTHLALVPDPRYEDAKVYENGLEEDEYENDKWITIHPNGEENKGRPLLLKDGEAPKQAIDRVYGGKKEALKAKEEEQGFQQPTSTKQEGEKKYTWNDKKYSLSELIEQGFHPIKYSGSIFKDDKLTYLEKDDGKKMYRLALSNEEYKEALKAKEDFKNKKLEQTKKDSKNLVDYVKWQYSKDIEPYITRTYDNKTIIDWKRLPNETKVVLKELNREEKIKLDAFSAREVSLDFSNKTALKNLERYRTSEKQNNKEDEMDVNELFEKMGNLIEEKFNACKKNEMEEEDKKKADGNDDELEYEGEKYSKKELVNAFKTMKKNEADAEAAKKVEEEKEEKENALGEEAYKKLEELLNSRKTDDESDKIKHESQADRIARGNEIFG